MSYSPIFIVGTPRSGTTLTAKVLGRQSQVFIGSIGFIPNIYARRHELGDPSSDFAARRAIIDRLRTSYSRFNNPAMATRVDELFQDGKLAAQLDARRSYGEMFTTFMEAQMAREGKRCWGNHVPRDLFELPQIFSLFPNAKVILCVRNALDFLVSYRDSFRRSERREKLQNAERLQSLYHPVVTSLLWTASMRVVRQACDRWGEHVLLNRYEDLVADPELQVRRICAFIGVEFESAMLAVDGNNSSESVNRSGIFTTSVGRWREKLPEADAFICQLICGNGMRHLGYAPVSLRAEIAKVSWRVMTTPVFAWRALSANSSRRASTVPYLTKRISALVRYEKRSTRVNNIRG